MESVLTVRMDEKTKLKGTQVMSSAGLTPSQAVRMLFDYAATNDRLPFPDVKKPSKREIERRLAAFDRCHTKEPLAMTDDEIRDERLRSRYALDG